MERVEWESPLVVGEGKTAEDSLDEAAENGAVAEVGSHAVGESLVEVGKLVGGSPEGKVAAEGDNTPVDLAVDTPILVAGRTYYRYVHFGDCCK